MSFIGHATELHCRIYYTMLIYCIYQMSTFSVHLKWSPWHNDIFSKRKQMGQYSLLNNGIYFISPIILVS